MVRLCNAKRRVTASLLLWYLTRLRNFLSLKLINDVLLEIIKPIYNDLTISSTGAFLPSQILITPLFCLLTLSDTSFAHHLCQVFRVIHSDPRERYSFLWRAY